VEEPPEPVVPPPVVPEPEEAGAAGAAVVVVVLDVLAPVPLLAAVVDAGVAVEASPFFALA
jgi:hypothetical protein